MPWLLYTIAFAGGALNALQSGTNASLKRALQAPLWSLAIVSGVTFLGSLAIVLVGREPLPSLAQVREAPLWAWGGGFCGLLYILAMIFTADKIGAAAFTGLTVTAAILVSLILDQFGLLGFSEHAATWPRWLGAALMIAGVVLVTRS